MSKLIDGLNKTARTENGALQYQNTGSYCLDFFTKVASMRGRNEEAYRLFKLASTENHKLALMILLWAYDCRGGAGEREVFKYILLNGIKDNELVYGWATIISHIPEYGRWDMLVEMLSDPIIEKCEAFQIWILKTITRGLIQENPLCAKWMPRQGRNAERIRNWLNKQKITQLTRKTYRQMLVRLSSNGNVVEQKMSSNQWDDINFSIVPSVAQTRYAKAFTKHTPERYKKYLDLVKSGRAKMQMTVAFPHECVRMLRGAGANPTVIDAANTAYEQLTKKININRNVLVMADVSGSMLTPVSGSINAMDISIGTAILVADHNTGPFKGHVLTFSDEPKLVKLSGQFYDKHQQIAHTQAPYGTNFVRAYMAILEVAKRDHLTNDDLPDTILVITDMEFDCAPFDDTHMLFIKKNFELYGYKVPEIVFWNLNQRTNGYAITKNMTKCAMISGYSPAILNTVFSDGPIDPVSIMMKTVAIPRYDIFSDTINKN